MRYTRGAFNTALDHLTRYSPMRTRVLSSCPSVVASSRPSAPVGSRPGWMPLTRSPRISNANLDEYLDGNMSFSLLLIVVAAAEARLRQSQFFFFTSFDQSVSEGLRRLLCLAPCVALRPISAPEPTSVLSNMMRYFTPYQPVASFGQPKHVCELPARQAATERLSRDARKASTSESKTDHIVRWVHTR
jgi:hypothetical protein